MTEAKIKEEQSRIPASVYHVCACKVTSSLAIGIALIVAGVILVGGVSRAAPDQGEEPSVAAKDARPPTVKSGASTSVPPVPPKSKAEASSAAQPVEPEDLQQPGLQEYPAVGDLEQRVRFWGTEWDNVLLERLPRPGTDQPMLKIRYFRAPNKELYWYLNPIWILNVIEEFNAIRKDNSDLPVYEIPVLNFHVQNNMLPGTAVHKEADNGWHFLGKQFKTGDDLFRLPLIALPNASLSKRDRKLLPQLQKREILSLGTLSSSHDAITGLLHSWLVLALSPEADGVSPRTDIIRSYWESELEVSGKIKSKNYGGELVFSKWASGLTLMEMQLGHALSSDEILRYHGRFATTYLENLHEALGAMVLSGFLAGGGSYVSAPVGFLHAGRSGAVGLGVCLPDHVLDHPMQLLALASGVYAITAGNVFGAGTPDYYYKRSNLSARLIALGAVHLLRSIPRCSMQAQIVKRSSTGLSSAFLGMIREVSIANRLEHIARRIVEPLLLPPDSTNEAPGSEEPTSTKQDSKKPEAKQPDSKKPDSKKPEAKQPDSKKPEAKKPDSKKPDLKKPDSKKPGAKKPDSKKPGAKKPEAKKQEAKKPEAKKPEAKKQETKKQETKKQVPKSPKAETPEPKLQEAPKPRVTPQARPDPGKSPE